MSPKQEPSLPRVRSFRRRSVLLIATPLLVGSLLLAIAPTLVGSSAGRSFVASRLGTALAAEVEIGGLDLSWGRGQQISALTLARPDEGIRVEIERVDMPDVSLVGLLLGGLRVGKVEISSPSVRLREKATEAGPDPESAASPEPTPIPEAEAAPSTLSLPPGLEVTLRVNRPTVIVELEDQEPVEIQGSEWLASLVVPGEVDVSIESTVRQGDLGGSFKLVGRGTDLFASDGTVDLESGHFGSTLRLENVPVAIADRFMAVPTSLETLLGPTLALDLETQIAVGGLGTFELKGQSQHLDAVVHAEAPLDSVLEGELSIEAVNLEARVSLDAVDVAAADDLLSLQGQLVALAGPRIDIDVDSKLTPGAAGTVTLQAKSGRLDAHLEGTVEQGRLRLAEQRRPVLIADAHEDFFAALRRANPTLAEGLHPGGRSRVELIIDELEVPWPSGQPLPQLITARLRGQVQASRLRLENPVPPYTVELLAPRATFDKPSSSPDVAVVVDSRLQSRTASQTTPISGVLSSTNQLRGLVADTTAGPASAVIETVTRIDGLAMSIVDAVMEYDGLIAGLIGPAATVEISGTIPSDRPSKLDVRLSTTSARAEMAATLGDDLVLRRPSTAQLAVTRSLSRVLLQKVLPFVEAKASTRPIQLTLQHEGFLVPLEAFDIRRVSLDMELDLGTLYLIEDGALLQFLRSVPTIGPLVSSEARFTPFHASLAHGVLHVDPGSMALGDLEFGFGGTVDLAQGGVDLALDLAVDSLARALGEEERAADFLGETLLLPIGGTVEAPAFSSRQFAREAGKLALSLGVQSKIKDLLGGDDRQASGSQVADESAQDPTEQLVEEAAAGLVRSLFKRKGKKKRGQ